MKYLLIKYITVGTPVYESETGPNIGYDNIEEGFEVIEEEALEDRYDPETIRSFKVLAELDEMQVRALHRQFSRAMRVGKIAA